MIVYSWFTRFRGGSYLCYCSEDRQVRGIFKHGYGSKTFKDELPEGSLVKQVTVSPMGMETLCFRELT